MRRHLPSRSLPWQKGAMIESRMPGLPIVGGVGDIADRYDGYIIDLWGVMHDGIRAYPGARDCLAALKARGKRIVILSNAPRRAAAVAVRNAELGIPTALYHGLVTSGEAAWAALASREDPVHRALGRRVCCLMPARDRPLLDELDLVEVARPDAAEFVLVTGVEGPSEQVADFEPWLAEALAAGRPMLCANPDLEVVRGGVREICAGAIAARYEAMGGRVIYHGKPHRPIYEACFAALGGIDRGRILAVGDSLRTDVAGARAAGIDSLFIAGGIHAEELGLAPGQSPTLDSLAQLCRAGSEHPTWAAAAFAW
jgi:HAD superfamily hydrolase (TIGR01459 family)